MINFLFVLVIKIEEKDSPDNEEDGYPLLGGPHFQVTFLLRESLSESNSTLGKI